MITPHEQQSELGHILGSQKLYFKREDLHPLGSHKGRSIPYMIDTYVKTGARHFAISSSGNAALAAGLYIRQLNSHNPEPINLDILVGHNITPKKLQKLEALKDDHIHISIHDKPKQALLVKIKDSEQNNANEKIISLRQSDDDTALLGYESLARELTEIPNLQAVFIGTSSGTTAQALAEYFLKEKKKIQVHLVQTPICHPIADSISGERQNNLTSDTSEKSIADAIVDRTALRKNTLAPLIQKTGGNAWIADNDSIRSAIDITKKHSGILISPNSALSVAGLMQAIYTSHTWKGSVACIICGD